MQYSVFIILFKILTLSMLMLVPTASLNYQETELATYNVVYLAYILTVIKLVLGINMVPFVQLSLPFHPPNDL